MNITSLSGTLLRLFVQKLCCTTRAVLATVTVDVRHVLCTYISVTSVFSITTLYTFSASMFKLDIINKDVNLIFFALMIVANEPENVKKDTHVVFA